MEVYRCINCMKEIEKGDSLCRHCGYGAAEYTQPLNALKINTILCGRYLVGRGREALGSLMWDMI